MKVSAFLPLKHKETFIKQVKPFCYFLNEFGITNEALSCQMSFQRSIRVLVRVRKFGGWYG